MRLKKEVDGKEIKFGAMGFNNENCLMGEGLEVWYIGDLSNACVSNSDVCQPGIWFLNATTWSQPKKIIDPSDPEGKKFLLPDVMDCETTADVYECVFLRKLSYSSIPGFQSLDANNSKTFKWRQVWNEGGFGNMKYHGGNKAPNVGPFEVDLRSVGSTPPPSPPPPAPPPPAPRPSPTGSASRKPLPAFMGFGLLFIAFLTN